MAGRQKANENAFYEHISTERHFNKIWSNRKQVYWSPASLSHESWLKLGSQDTHEFRIMALSLWHRISGRYEAIGERVVSFLAK